MKKIITLTLLVSIAYCSAAQETLPAFRASADSLKKHLSFLASDSLKGRKTGTEGQKMAAAYIAQLFSKWGLMPIGKEGGNAYYQPFVSVKVPIRCFNTTDIGLQIKGGPKSLRFPSDDFIILSRRGFGNTSITPYTGSHHPGSRSTNYAAVAFAQSLDEVLAMAGRAGRMDTSRYLFFVLPDSSLKKFSYDRFQFSLSNYYTDELETETTSPTDVGANYYYAKVLPFLQKHPNLNIILINRPFLSKLFGRSIPEGKLRTGSSSAGRELVMKGFYLPDSLVQTRSENVVGIIEGTSKKEEAVILCAHYDHLGIKPPKVARAGSKPDTIFNGADDNASGTSAILEVARLLAQAKKEGRAPRRTVIIVAFTAEEMGLIGSRYMVRHPIFPLNQTKLVVNLDMVGRTCKSHSDTSMYVYSLVLGKPAASVSPLLHQSGSMAGIDIDSPISAKEKERWTYGSDHYFFVKKGVPAVVLTTGEHPDYHTPADEASKICYPRLTRISSFAFHTVWMLANE